MTDRAAGRAGNVAALFLASVAGRGLTVLYALVVARALGLEAFGRFATVTAALAVLGVVADFGLSRLVVRDVARQPALAGSRLAASLLLRLGLAVLAYAALLGGTRLWGLDPADQRAFDVGGLVLLPAAAALAPMAILNAREEMGRVATLQALVGVVTLLLAWPVLQAGWGVTGLLASFVVAHGLQAALAAWWVLAGRGETRMTWSMAAAWRLGRAARAYAAFQILSIVFARAGTIVLAALQGPEAAGLYTAAFRLVEALALVPVALVNALFPLMAVQAAAGPDGPLGRTYRDAVRALGLLALPLAAGTTLLAGPVVAVVYGPAFAAAGPVLAILAWGLAVLYLNAPVGNVILGSDRAGRYLPWAALHTGATVAATAALAGRLGATGAAIAFVAAEVAGFGLQCWFVRSLVGRLPDFPRLLARPALAALVMALAVAGLARLGTHLFALVPAGMLVYFGGLLALGELGERDRARVRQWLGRRRSGASVGAGRSGGG